MKELITQSSWIIDLATQESINVPIWIIVDFQQRVRQNSQNFNNDTFQRSPVITVQCNIGTERYLDSAIFLNYVDDDYSQGYD